MHQTLKFTAITAALFASAMAHATTYTAAQIKAGTTPGATFSATGGSLVLKSQYGVQGIGVSGGRTSDEIDIGESVKVSFAKAVDIKSFSLAYLYDGPEFGDVQEKAQVTVSFADLTTKSYSLTALYSNSYSWTGLGTVTNPYPNIDTKGGLWTVTNPFGNAAVTGLAFTALQGICGKGLSCNNQSDFGLSSVITAPVPEPETYAMMFAGLGVIGLVSRRRKSRQ
jgi:PEP-CTERM motif